MDNASPTTRPLGQRSLPAVPYVETEAAEPSIPITSTSTLVNRLVKKRSGLQRPTTATSQQTSVPTTPSKTNSYVGRDSGLASSTVATARDSRTTLATEADSAPSPKISPSIPSSSVPEDSLLTLPKMSRRWGTRKGPAQEGNGLLSPPPRGAFPRIATEIPTGSLDDLTMPGRIEFSNRGSMLLGGTKINQANVRSRSHSRTVGSRRLESMAASLPIPAMPTRIISTDDELLSQKVRSLYEGEGNRDFDAIHGRQGHDKNYPKGNESRPGEARSQPTGAKGTSESASLTNRNLVQKPVVTSESDSLRARDENEVAGGIEDWEDLEGSEVDRYGFIIPKRSPSPTSGRSVAIGTPRVQRVTTSLQVASEAPRRKRSTVRRTPSTTRSTTTPGNASLRSWRPSSRGSQHGSLTRVPSKIRTVTNRLPHNKDRRAMDEAADMLTLPPGLADIAEDVCIKAAAEAKRKEWEREDKWRKMAKVVNNKRDGGGMMFEFDTNSPKLIERTWKGIPDRWRATAWHAFLTASAKKRPGSPTDEELIATFHTLIDQGSPDDVQIDIDVPRTISSHIMFRRRYRGGQRLLFRVLHCLSIYFPDTGYVQGMAALAATLLCYFDEEMTFVMLVRLWQLRGLEHLYQSGFKGLMQALDEFEEKWLGEREIAIKLVGSLAQ